MRLSVYLAIYLSVCLSVYLQARKQSYSARLPHFFKLTASKTKPFGETSSTFELDNVKNEAILRGFLNFPSWQDQKQINSAMLPSKMERWVQSWRPRTNAYFAMFPLHLSKVLRLPGKSNARSYEVLHLSCKNIVAHLKIWCSKVQPVSGIQCPDLLRSLMNMSLVLRLPRDMHLCRSSHACHRFGNCYKALTFCSLFTRCTIPCLWHTKRHLNVQKNVQKCSVPVIFLHFWLRNVLRATTACTFSTCQLPKVPRDRQFLTLLTSKCASRHNSVHFFDMSTSKSAPALEYFVHFYFEMCFAPQRHALFRRLNFQKCSETVSF